jgi:hypothetical protein
MKLVLKKFERIEGVELEAFVEFFQKFIGSGTAVQVNLRNDGGEDEDFIEFDVQP